jgi:hypothetical protein
MNPFRNLALNLQATGPAAVLCVLLLSIAAVGVFGSDKLGPQALGLLAAALGVVATGLIARIQ